MTKRTPMLMLLAGAAVGVACGTDKIVKPEEPTPAFGTLQITPSVANIVQGGSATVAATLTLTRRPIGVLNLTVTGVPTGVSALISNVQNNGLVTSATVALNANGSAPPGAYSLEVHAWGAGVVTATASFGLTVETIPPCLVGAICEQWATSAKASSEYTSTNWGAYQATGQPNTAGCDDDPRAWASLESNGVDWLELEFKESVRPIEIRIHEVFGVSSIVKVEVKDGAGTYHTVYTAAPEKQTCRRVLAIPVSGISAMVNVVRLSFDQRTLNEWNEIDAVKLIGQSAEAIIAGVYNLTAPITRDPAWGYTGCRYTGVLTLQQGSGDSFGGTYSDLQFICPNETSAWKYTGSVIGTIDRGGRAGIHLVGGNHDWTTWWGQGELVAGEIVGIFACCDDLSGTFTIERRP
ncbi:MAG TPA: hypothetical protein VGN73_11995 [Gemmatimonadaceae bacterium]|nr:hypothetical protein [Gemmatimonadaceae bacterium]